MKNRLFEIVSLSDRPNYNLKDGDPISGILGGSLSLLSGLFPNIFGGNRKALTSSDWLTLLPGSGYWSTKLRNYMALHIKYDVDYINNIQEFTRNFVDENKSGICPNIITNNETNFLKCYNAFIDIITRERASGGTSYPGETPGGYGSTLDLNSLLPIALIGIVLIFMKNKK
jgi:hypothetical protein